LQIASSAGEHLPPILISTQFMPQTYTVHLTDLVHIWSESLDRQAIIQRSREEATSIDPSAGDDQFQIFISKLKLALEGDSATTLALTIDKGTDRPSLTINISVSLPGGLAPLDWSMHLSASPPLELTNQLIMPLLSAQHQCMQEMTGLVGVLRDKDHLIQKLLDRLENQGTELSELFPQAGRKVGRKLDRKVAEERVKGLGLFDIDKWKAGLNLDKSPDTTHLLHQVFAVGSANAVIVDNELELVDAKGLHCWWENIKGITVNLATGQVSTNGIANRTKPSQKPVLKKQVTIEDEEDVFQVQADPPHWSKSARADAAGGNESISTEDDNELPSQSSGIPNNHLSILSTPSPPRLKKRIGKVGKVGAKKIPTKSPSFIDDDASTADEDESPQKSDIDPKNKKSTLDNGDKASTDDDLPLPNESPPKTIARLETEEVPTKLVRRLGKIGGKKEAPPLKLEQEPEVEPDAEQESTSQVVEIPKPKRGNLGKIRGKQKTVEPPQPEPQSLLAHFPTTAAEGKGKMGMAGGFDALAADTKAESSMDFGKEIPDRGRQKSETMPEKRETSMERADRRRAELKRELEEKSKAPAKRKRKF